MATDRPDDLDTAAEHFEQLQLAVAAIAAGDETGPTLDRRDRALCALWGLGVTRAVLVQLSGMPARTVAALVEGSRPPGRGSNARLTALLLTLAELE